MKKLFFAGILAAFLSFLYSVFDQQLSLEPALSFYGLGLQLNKGNALYLFPISCLVFVFVPNFFFSNRWLVVSSYVLLYAVLGENLVFSCITALIWAALYWMTDYFSKKIRGTIFLVAIAINVIPVLVFAPKMESLFLFWLFFHIRLGMGLRFLSWSHYVILESGNRSFREYLEYMFNPIFFMNANAIAELPYRHFQAHNFDHHVTYKKIRLGFLLSIYGLSFLLMERLFQKKIVIGIFAPYLWKTSNMDFSFYYIGSLLLFGLAMTCSAIWYHIGTLGIQVGLARLLGFSFRYPMYFPFLSRNPKEYWERSNNFVREYWLNLMFRPLFLFFLRKQWPRPFVYLCSAGLTYLAFSLLATGYRPFYWSRTMDITIYMVLTYALLVAVPFSIHLLLSNRKKPFAFLSWYFNTDFKEPLSSWKGADFIRWAITFFLFSAFRGIFEIYRIKVGSKF